MLWRQVEESTRIITHEEKVICSSLLCNHIKESFRNPCMQTWEKALCAGLKAMVGRTEDVHLYQRGAAAENKFARSHLNKTAEFAEMDEAKLIEHLTRTPYPEMMWTDDFFTVATAAFFIGQNAFKALFQDLFESLADGDAVLLRFATHLILYLDSTTVGPSAASFQWDSNQIRDHVVIDYIQSMASRELWNMIVLYASMLPKDVMLQHLPPLLVPVTSANDRKIVVTQLRDLLPESDLDFLRAVVEQEERQ